MWIIMIVYEHYLWNEQRKKIRRLVDVNPVSLWDAAQITYCVTVTTTMILSVLRRQTGQSVSWMFMATGVEPIKRLREKGIKREPSTISITQSRNGEASTNYHMILRDSSAFGIEGCVDLIYMVFWIKSIMNYWIGKQQSILSGKERMQGENWDGKFIPLFENRECQYFPVTRGLMILNCFVLLLVLMYSKRTLSGQSTVYWSQWQKNQGGDAQILKFFPTTKSRIMIKSWHPKGVDAGYGTKTLEQFRFYLQHVCGESLAFLSGSSTAQGLMRFRSWQSGRSELSCFISLYFLFWPQGIKDPMEGFLGVSGTGIGSMVFLTSCYFGSMETSLANAMTLMYTAPVFVAIFARLFLGKSWKERCMWRLPLQFSGVPWWQVCFLPGWQWMQAAASWPGIAHWLCAL